MRLRCGLVILGSLALAGAAACAAPPGAATAPTAQAPQDVERLYAEGVQARHAGRTQDAIALLSRAAAAQPRNADVLLQLGLALTDARQYADARAKLQQVLRLAPGYVDARLALARLDLREGRTRQAQAQLQAVLAADPQQAEALLLQASMLLQAGQAQAAEKIYRERLARAPSDAQALIGLGDSLREQRRDAEARQAYARANELQPGSTASRRLALPEQPHWRLDLNAGLSYLSNDLPDWREGSIRLAYSADARTTYSGGTDVSHRFGTTDTYLEGRVDHQFTRRLAAYAYAGGTPDASFLPQIALGGGLSARLQQPGIHNPTFATLDGRYAHYVTGTVWSLNPGVVQYLDSDRIWLTGKWINTRDEQSRYLTGWSLRADWQVRERLRLLAGYANAPESSDGITVRTRAVYGGLVYDLNDRNSVQVTAAREERTGLYNRNSITVGWTVRF
jgi:YaiO family outer membrane protein